MSEIINGFINKEGTIFEFENSGLESSECQINREEVEQIINETLPATHAHTKSQITDFPAIDDTPQGNSNNLVTSGGVKAALDGKVDKASTYSNGHLVCFGTGGGMSDSGVSKNNLNDKLAKLDKLVTVLPSLASVSNGDEYIYIGATDNSLQFGQTYKATKNGVSVEYHITAAGTADDVDKWGTQEYTGYSSALQNIQYTLETLGAETPYEWGLWHDADWDIDDDIVFTSDRYATEAAFKEAIEQDLNGLCTSSFNGSIAANEWTPKFALKSELPAES